MAINFLNNIDLNQNQLLNVRVHVSGSEPSGKGEGSIWLDSGNDTLKFYVADTGGGSPGWLNVLDDTASQTTFTLAATTSGTATTVNHNDTITIAAGSGISTTGTSDGVITIANTAAAGNSFGTVVVSGSSNVVADQANDSLTLVAAGGMTITQVAGTDTVTFTSADTNTTYSVGDGGLTTNDFTNADHSKLNAIEASADVTDVTNVTAAGAVMDGEVTNLAFVKALAKGISDGNVLTANDVVADDDFLRINGTEVEGLTIAEVLAALNVEAGATGDQTNAEIRAAVEAASDSNAFTDTDHSKLNAIEASATADQSNAEIVAAVEAGTDSNTFTDADHTKLNAIEAAADVTDTANVKSALGATIGGNALTIGDSDTVTTIPGDLTVTGTTTTNNVVTVSTSNGVSFEGAAADGHDALLVSVVASSDKTYTLPNVTGYVGLFAADPGTTTISSTPAELNTLDGFDGDVDDLKYAKDLYDTGVTATEFNYLDGVESDLQTQLNAKQASLTFGKSSGNALKSEEALTTNDILLMGSAQVKGRTYAQLKADLSLEIGTDVQAYNANIATTSTNWAATDITSGTLAVARGGTGVTANTTWLNSNVTPTTLGLVIGTNVQAYDAQLASVAGWSAAQVTTLGTIGTVTTGADKMIYTSGADTFTETAITSFGRSILDDANEATFKATVNLEIGTDVQAYDANYATPVVLLLDATASGDVSLASSTYTLTHDFGTRNVTVKLYETGGDYQEVFAEVQHITTAAVAIVFGSAPTVGAYTAHITKN